MLSFPVILGTRKCFNRNTCQMCCQTTGFHQPVLITQQACEGDLSPARETFVQTCQPWGLGRPSTFHPSEFPAPEPSPTANVLPSQTPRRKQLPLSPSARGQPPAHRFDRRPARHRAAKGRRSPGVRASGVASLALPPPCSPPSCQASHAAFHCLYSNSLWFQSCNFIQSPSPLDRRLLPKDALAKRPLPKAGLPVCRPVTS